MNHVPIEDTSIIVRILETADIMQLKRCIYVNVYERNQFMNRQVLRRSRSNRVVAGVCGGLGEFFGINSAWFRLAFLLMLLPGGVPGLLTYTILWIIVPNE